MAINFVIIGGHLESERCLPLPLDQPRSARSRENIPQQHQSVDGFRAPAAREQRIAEFEADASRLSNAPTSEPS